MSDMAVVFLILGLTIALFLWGKLPSDLVAILSLLGLFFAGLVSPVEALAGFSNSTVILVGALFVVGELIIAVFESESKELVWEGSGSRRVNRSGGPERSERRIQDAVNQILRSFPPGA